MTIQEMIDFLSKYSYLLAAAYAATPCVAFIYGRILGEGKGVESPYKYIYSFLVYFASIPGVFGAVLTAYALFFLRANLLKADLVVYFLPIVTMICTIFIVKKDVDLEKVPGFDRLYGL
ncbi:MAG: hypothetical protein GY835_11380, partial [bacterium]|nr:hypothetical protein [bacterium]